MNALNIAPQTHTTLRQICLITDGNHHTQPHTHIAFSHPDIISESMLPEIRTYATLIATARHHFSQRSPTHFTDEADWFAARIIALRVHQFHLDVTKKPMLDIANQRAQAFAAQHKIAFQPAKIRPSLHANRPENILLMECHLHGEIHKNIWENSRKIGGVINLL